MDRDVLPNTGELLGRVLLGLLFVLEGVSKLRGYDGAARYMTAHGMPAILLPAVIALEIIGGAMIIAGWWTRCAAAALATFCVVAAVIFHTRFGDRNQVIHFEKNLALAGAFLLLWVRGAGAFSLDAWRARRRSPPAN
jgi:putative oxidoreductase